MFVAILILLVLPFTDTSNIKGSSYKPLFTIAFWLFALNFLVLMWLGSCHVEPPFIVAGQVATFYYFLHFLVILPILGIIDNVLSILAITWIGNHFDPDPIYKPKPLKDWSPKEISLFAIELSQHNKLSPLRTLKHLLQLRTEEMLEKPTMIFEHQKHKRPR